MKCLVCQKLWWCHVDVKMKHKNLVSNESTRIKLSPEVRRLQTVVSSVGPLSKSQSLVAFDWSQLVLLCTMRSRVPQGIEYEESCGIYISNNNNYYYQHYPCKTKHI